MNVPTNDEKWARYSAWLDRIQIALGLAARNRSDATFELRITDKQFRIHDEDGYVLLDTVNPDEIIAFFRKRIAMKGKTL